KIGPRPELKVNKNTMRDAAAWHTIGFGVEGRKRRVQRPINLLLRPILNQISAIALNPSTKVEGSGTPKSRITLSSPAKLSFAGLAFTKSIVVAFVGAANSTENRCQLVIPGLTLTLVKTPAETPLTSSCIELG